MPSPKTRAKLKQTFFAVASVGKDRWYWVVWPSLAQLRAGEVGPHLAEGYEKAKAEAVDRALEVAGMNGEWVAAKYARQYHRQHRQARGSGSVPLPLEFLYQDHRDPATREWYSRPHRVVKKTKKYVYVERRPYDSDQRTGSWLDDEAETFRLNRHMLETEGYVLTPIAEVEDPLFFTTPYQERATQPLTCFLRLGLSFPCTVAEVKAAYRRLVKQVHPDQGGNHDEFLKLQVAYEQALRLCQG